MEPVRIIEKPNDLSYEVIKKVLHEAHQSNFEKGIVLHTTQLSADELDKRVGKAGKCFVAMCDNKIAGTASYRIETRNNWYVKGKVVDEILVGVLPEYKGQHIYSLLYNTIEEEAKEQGYDIIVFNTAEKNTKKQKIALKKGFRYVNYFVAEDNDHYSVVMAKWLSECPFSELKLRLEYNKRRVMTRLKYKPGKIRRFKKY